MNNSQMDLEGYKLATGIDINRGEFAMKIFVLTDHDFGAEEELAFYQAREVITEAVRKESLRIKPETAASACKERAEIIALFPSPIYVEEIPNGYCSRFCCAFKPWFIVTTAVGRIKIGWRKRVIHLEWTDSAITQTAKEIFPKEEAWPGYETTQYDKVIHAHGYSAAKNYIDRLLAAGTGMKP